MYFSNTLTEATVSVHELNKTSSRHSSFGAVISECMNASAEPCRLPIARTSAIIARPPRSPPRRGGWHLQHSPPAALQTPLMKSLCSRYVFEPCYQPVFRFSAGEWPKPPGSPDNGCPAPHPRPGAGGRLSPPLSTRTQRSWESTVVLPSLRGGKFKK